MLSISIILFSSLCTNQRLNGLLDFYITALTYIIAPGVRTCGDELLLDHWPVWINWRASVVPDWLFAQVWHMGTRIEYPIQSRITTLCTGPNQAITSPAVHMVTVAPAN